MVDAGSCLARAVHDHARQHRRERRPAGDPERPQADLSALQWIVTGYALTFAALMLIGGKLADAYGRRLIFILGIVIFTLASLWCGLAGSGEMLIAARVVQGAGAALMNPATLSIIAATFPPRERGDGDRDLGRPAALALAIGPLVGGLLTEHLSWNWIFFVNIPIGIVAIVASQLLITESKDETHVRPSISRASRPLRSALFALTYGLIEANTYGWTSLRASSASFVVAASCIVRLHPTRAATSAPPMLDLSLFRSRTYAGANIAMLLRTRNVRGLLLRLAVHAERPRLLARRDRRGLPADDGSHHPRPARSPERLSDRYRLAVAGLDRDGAARRSASLPLAARSRRELLEDPAWVLDRRCGDVHDHDPDGGGRDARAVPVAKAGVGSAVLNAMRQVGGSLGIALMGAIVAHERAPRRRGVPRRLPERPHGGVFDCLRRGDRRVLAHSPGGRSRAGGAPGGGSLNCQRRRRSPEPRRT